VQQQRRGLEVINQVDQRRNFELLRVVGVNLDQHAHVVRADEFCDFANEGQCLGGHERVGAGGLHRVADGV
jgi:hypothetical protein